MNKDTIYRSDAVSEIHKYFCEEIDSTSHETDEDGEDVYTDMLAVNSLLTYNKQLSKRIKALPSAQYDTDEWCHDCKEYDADRHSCPRWNRVIRQAVEEAKIIHCKDCTFYDLNMGECDHKFGLLVANENSHCSLAERRNLC